MLALAAPALLLPAAPGARAQERGDTGDDGAIVADTSSPSMLEEQISGLGDGDEIDRPAGAARSAVPAGGWRFTLRLRGSSVLQEAAGYARGTYAGNRLSLRQKISVRKGDVLRIEFLTDKDPGEAGVTDFVSASVQAGGLPGDGRIVAGDFRFRAGQGLLFGAPRSYGKGVEAVEPAIRSGWGIPAGISSDESDFFRGLAVQFAAGPVSAAAFVSLRKQTPLLGPDGVLKGIDRSGYHRTGPEIGRRARLDERTAGGSVRLSSGERAALGIHLLTARMTAGGAPSPGASIAVRRASVDARVGIGALTCFGEATAGASGPWIAGVVFAGAGFRSVVSRRRYPRADGFHAASGFSDGSTGSNEEGTYLGIETTPAGGASLSAALDLFRKTAPVPGSVQPPAGLDRIVTVRLVPFGGLTGILSLRSRSAETREGGDGGSQPAVPRNVRTGEVRIRCEAKWESGPGSGCGLRFDRVRVSPGSGAAREDGAMVTASFTARLGGGAGFDVTARFFATDSYASGIPAVEGDLPGSLTAAVYSGRGTSWSAGCSWRVARSLRITARYSILRRGDVRRIGSGPGELPSNVKEKAGVQLDLGW